MKVLDVAASRDLDRLATEDYGIPSLLLMENAALGVVEALVDNYSEAERVLILCGPGNNGGDGLAVARHLDIRGFEVEVWRIGPGELQGDAAVQQGICERQGLAVRQVLDSAGLPSAETWDVVVDALFGSGLNRGLEGIFADIVAWLEGDLPPCLAIDLPSGLSGDREHPAGPHLTADLTVTFEAPKPAHVLPPACDAVGELVIADLGVPSALARTAASDLTLVTVDVAAGWLAERPRGAHKGDFGHVLVAAGSLGMGGAAVLAARGAIRGGAGLVTCAVPESVLATVDAASLESMTIGLPAVDGRFASEALELLQGAAAARDVVAMGPGLGQDVQVEVLVRSLLSELAVPVVLDAGGLGAFAGRLAELRERPAATILTPHAGELARLLGVDIGEVTADRMSAAREAHRLSGAIVVLKGQASLIVGDEGVWINTTGNPGMASGGTGDVLTGLVAALWARGLGGVEAAALGAFVHGAAGDLAAEEVGETALAASDLLLSIPEVLRHLENS